jgi:hypothetical protein
MNNTMNNTAIMQEIKEDFINRFNASGGVDSIKEYGLEILIEELKALGMSEEAINANLTIINDELNKLMDKLVALATDKIHSCKLCSQEGVTGVCFKCKKVYYCSKECQVAHWSIHKKVCKKT